MRFKNLVSGNIVSAESPDVVKLMSESPTYERVVYVPPEPKPVEPPKAPEGDREEPEKAPEPYPEAQPEPEPEKPKGKKDHK